MNKIKASIPNAITSMNLFSGCIACVMAFNENFFWATMFIYLASIFDFFDGLSARALKVSSPIGKELDSLADMVSFGLAPGVILYAWLSSLFSRTELFPLVGEVDLLSRGNQILPYIAFLISVFSALRLAKFNIDERQTSSFIGLPTPANSIFIASLISLADMSATSNPMLNFLSEKVAALCGSVVFIIVLIILFSWLLVSEIPMFSLKVKNLRWADNKIRFIFLILSVLMTILLWWGAAPLIILLFILMSILTGRKS
ncbi:MAG: CDP-alcohol phosphatidyltransferase family protein [Paludibacteraceae bacterium]|nr:CDP-alcohol phosphatidyltransferase family protein [Paludibacteraceae bacterium]